MKIHFVHRQEFLDGMQFAILTHVRVEDGAGRYLAFVKITPPLIEFIRKMDFDIPEHLLNQRGKTCLNNQTPNI